MYSVWWRRRGNLVWMYRGQFFTGYQALRRFFAEYRVFTLIITA